MIAILWPCDQELVILVNVSCKLKQSVFGLFGNYGFNSDRKGEIATRDSKKTVSRFPSIYLVQYLPIFIAKRRETNEHP